MLTHASDLAKVLSYWDNLPVVQLLLRNQANAALHNQRGYTALKLADARWKRIQGKSNAVHEQQQLQGIIKLLKQAGAKE